MAGTRNKPDEQAAVEQSLAANAEAVEEQQEIVEDELAQEQDAQERRDRERDRAQHLKTSLAADAEAPPSQRRTSSGDTAYSRDRWLSDSQEFLGVEPHVVAGALFGVENEYLTAKEVEKLVDTFLNTESFTHPVGVAPVEA